MPEGKEVPDIERSKPQGAVHGLTSKAVLDSATESMRSKAKMVSLAQYLKEVAGKPRGRETKGKEDLNSPTEEFIVKDAEGIKVRNLQELQAQLAELGVPFELLGVESIGNPNQTVAAVVQGVDEVNPKSGFERPVVAEGPHMVLAPFAVDKRGQLHVFRTIQYRTGSAQVDTPRGFADAKALESGEQLYQVEEAGENVKANMQRVLGEEGGEGLLQIKRVVYLGSPRVNASFVTSKSALFAVEVDYDKFVQSSKLITEEELQRRREQEEHEGLIGGILDINLSEYVNYKRNSEIPRDLTADAGSDMVVIDFMGRQLDKLQRRQQVEVEANKGFKKSNPQGYLEYMLHRSKANKPESYEANRAKADRFAQKLK